MITKFDLFLFDFDGLLVDSEPFHYRAWKDTLYENNISFPDNITDYCTKVFEDFALFTDSIRSTTPLNWSKLHTIKAQKMLTMVSTKHVPLKNGALALLKALDALHKTKVVVTNSTKEFVETVLRSKPALKALIDGFITRGDYSQPKPHAECYELAMKRYNSTNAVGFEDSLKGVQALLDAKVEAFWVLPNQHPLKIKYGDLKCHYHNSLTELLPAINLPGRSL